MTAPILIEQAGERRRVEPAELPLVIGGPESDIRLSGAADRAPAAYIGSTADGPFVQPVLGGVGVLCNGSPLATSQWLREGDVIVIGSTRILTDRLEEQLRLTVEERVTEVDTEPPMIVAPPPVTPPRSEASPATVAPVEFTPTALRRSRRRSWALHPLLLVTWVALALLAGAAWYLFTARAVEIRVLPEPDELTVEGTLLQLELGGRKLLRPGRYRLIAAKEGYRRLETALEISRRPSQVHEFELEKLPGLLAVTTIPGRGAKVVIDGETRGVTPLEPIEMSPGRHTLEVGFERFEPVTKTVDIEGGGATTSLTIELTPLWAPVSLDSRPPGAAVRIDGEAVGRTPVVADVLQGSHDVEFRLEGHKPQRLSLQVLAGQPLSVPPVRLRPVDGWLVLTSEPDGATVTIDGDYRGQTPMELELTPGTDHRISLSKQGYEAAGGSVRIESGRSRELHLTLEPRFGEIEIACQPADAELLVNGESRGPANQTLRLQAVTQEIEVRKAGFESFRQTVTPRPGFPQSLRITLRTEEQARKAARLAVIQGPQGQELRLVDPGSFRMGASRREPGRRANETLRDVELTRPFYLATEEVSNREFREFRERHRSGAVGQSSLDKDDHPVVEVTWEDAARYCNWLSAKAGLPAAYVERNGRLVGANPMTTGFRLPTEAEWAWAARFAGGGTARKYPWGNALPVAPGSGNYADASAGSLLGATLSGYNDGYSTTAPVDSFEPNPLGILNLGGNVAEWVHDFYAIYPSGSGNRQRDPMGPEEGEYHVIRGSSWMDSTITELRFSFRDYGSKPRADVGFRVARYAD